MSTEENEFPNGCLVKLKSSENIMVVSDSNDYNGVRSATCVWITEDGTPYEETYPYCVLDHVL